MKTIYDWLTTDANIVNDAELTTAETNIKSNVSSEAQLTRQDISSLNDISASDVWNYATRTLSDYSGVWSVATRTLTAFGFAVDLSSTALDNIDTRINQSHGVGLYNTTGLTSSDISDIADAVWDEAQSGHTTSGTFGYFLDSQVSSIETTNNTAIADAVWTYNIATNRTTGATINDTYMQLLVWGGSSW